METTLSPISPMGTFGSLPAELRNRIYKYLLISPSPIHIKVLVRFGLGEFDYQGNKVRKRVAHSKCMGIYGPILRVCKAINIEALYVLYGMNTYVVNEPFQSFFYFSILHGDSNFSAACLAVIRSIEVEVNLLELVFGLKRTYQRIAEHCPRLRNLTVNANQEWRARDVDGYVFNDSERARKHYDMIFDTDVSQEQWDEIWVKERSVDKTTGGFTNYCVGLLLEQAVTEVPKLRNLKLQGLLDDSLGKAALEQLKEKNALMKDDKD